MAEFPYLAQWVGNQRYSSAKDRETAVLGWSGMVQRLSEELRTLKLALERDPPQRSELTKAAEQVRNQRSAVREAMASEALQNAGELHQQRIWHLREALLSVPLLVDTEGGEDPVVMRRKLIEMNRRTSAKLHAETTGKLAVVAADAGKDEAAQDNARVCNLQAAKNFMPAFE